MITNLTKCQALEQTLRKVNFYLQLSTINFECLPLNGRNLLCKLQIFDLSDKGIWNHHQWHVQIKLEQSMILPPVIQRWIKELYSSITGKMIKLETAHWSGIKKYEVWIQKAVEGSTIQLFHSWKKNCLLLLSHFFSEKIHWNFYSLVTAPNQPTSIITLMKLSHHKLSKVGQVKIKNKVASHTLTHPIVTKISIKWLGDYCLL